MSLTSDRSAPPRVYGFRCVLEGGCAGDVLLSGVWFGFWFLCPWRAWRRPTLPRLETQYPWRWVVSRPISGWDRVGALRCGQKDVDGQSDDRRQRSHVTSSDVRSLLSAPFLDALRHGRLATTPMDGIVPVRLTHSLLRYS